MRGDELWDAMWERLSERLHVPDCPGCGEPLRRCSIHLQPVDERLFVICDGCDYRFFDDSPYSPIDGGS
jgi:hypothetical protein